MTTVGHSSWVTTETLYKHPDWLGHKPNFAIDGNTLAVSDNETINIFDRTDRASPRNVCQIEIGYFPLWHLALYRGSVIGAELSKLAMWQVKPDGARESTEVSPPDQVWCMARCENLLLTGGNRSVTVWNLDQQLTRETSTGSGLSGHVNRIAVCGRRVIVGSGGYATGPRSLTLFEVDVSERKIRHICGEAIDEYILDVKIRGCAVYVLLTNAIQVWKVQDNKLVREMNISETQSTAGGRVNTCFFNVRTRIYSVGERLLLANFMDNNVVDLNEKTIVTAKMDGKNWVCKHPDNMVVSDDGSEITYLVDNSTIAVARLDNGDNSR